MDGTSWFSSSNGESIAMTSFLTFVVIAPALLWGLWIVSEESFDELNSRDRLHGLLVKSFRGVEIPNQISTRQRRKKFLPFYFIALIFLVTMLYFLVLEKPQYLSPLLILVGVLTIVALYTQKRQKRVARELSRLLESELPAQIQLITILISSGMTPAKALSVIATRSSSLSSLTLDELIREIEGGLSIVQALDHLAQKFDSLVLRRFITSLILGIERGSALSPILIDQVRDARMVSKGEIMRRAGKAEIGLMIPVVFLILPISILFALWPSYQQLGSFM